MNRNSEPYQCCINNTKISSIGPDISTPNFSNNLIDILTTLL